MKHSQNRQERISKLYWKNKLMDPITHSLVLEAETNNHINESKKIKYILYKERIARVVRQCGKLI